MFMDQSGVAAATLEDLLSCHDETFVRNAYHALLGRAPDQEGMQYYLARIRNGISKIEILAQLLFSTEGKSRLVKIAGLNEAICQHKLLSSPLFGPLMNFAGTVQQQPNLSAIDVASLPTFGERYKAFRKGETEVSKILARGYLRFHLDTPEIGLVNLVRDTCVVSGWAVDLKNHLAVKVRIVTGQTIHATTTRQREDVQREFSHLCQLPIGTGFSCALKLPLGVHRLRIEVEGIDGSWIAVRSAVVVRVPGRTRVQSRKPKLTYKEWVALDSQQLDSDIPDIKRQINEMTIKPTFTVIVDTRQGQSGLKDTIQSVRGQLYPSFKLRILSDKVSLQLPEGATILQDMSLADVRGQFVVLLQSGQLLARNALYEFSVAINKQPDADLIYGDEDSMTVGMGRNSPFHKPGWSPDYLETFNYIGFTACFRTSIARSCFENARLYDLVLRFTERTARVVHIAKILGHSKKGYWHSNQKSAQTVAHNIAALSGRLGRTGRRGFVSENELHKGCYDIRIELERSPLVSIVIPTAGKTASVGKRRIDLIVNVVRQIRNISSYKNVEIIVVDNGDLTFCQLSFLESAQCKLITYTNPVFNIAKKLNLGVSIATGEFMLLMNDDIEILTPAWIERLLEHFEKPHVGVVGAKLVYPNEETQHVGVVQPFGNPDHVRRSFARNEAGYFFSTCGVRNFTAVTGAVMMARAGIYREVGGYSDELAVCFNDVDFCMKVGRKGLTVVYTPRAELIHMESISRVVELDMSELSWFHKRWAAELVSDQFYNDRFLTVEPPTFVPCVN